MKKTPFISILLAIVMLGSAMLASCEKDNDTSNTTTLDNTRWECTYDVTFHNVEDTDQGITQTMTFFISENKLALTLGAEYYSLIFTQMTEK